MGPDRLDKFIKKQVEQHKTPTDPDLLWQKIQAKQGIEEKPKRRFFIFWLFGGVLLLSSVLFWYNYSTVNNDTSLSGNENPIENATSTSAASEKEAAQSGLNNNNTTTQTNSLSDNKSSNTNASFGFAQDKNANSKSTDKKTNDLNNKKGITKTKTPQSTNKSKNSNTQSASSSKNQKTKTIQSDTNNQGISSASNTNSSKPGVVNSTTPEKQEVIISIENKLAVNDSNPSSTQESKKETSIAENNQSENDITAFAKSKLLNLSSVQVLIDEEMIASNFVKEQKEKKDFLPYTHKDRDKNNSEIPWVFSNGFGFNYGKAPRTMSERSNTPADYLQTRKDMETSLDAVRINLDLMAQHKSGVYLKSGIEYEQINERFDSYTEWDSIYFDPDRIIARKIDMDGNQTDSLGGAKIITQWWRTKRYNRYHSIDIPLLLGYNSTNQDRKLSWFIEAGASVNLWFKARGEIYDTTNQPIRMEDNADLFKPRTGISLLAATGLSYRVSDHLSIWSSPTIKYHLSSITSDENVIDQKYLNVGLQLGIRYHWMK